MTGAIGFYNLFEGTAQNKTVIATAMNEASTNNQAARILMIRFTSGCEITLK